MEALSRILVASIAVEHIYILYMEMFAWETLGRKIFKGAIPDELFKLTKKSAANQGLYNGFLAAGLIWSFFISNELWQRNISIFFTSCIVIAGIFGAITVSKKIFFTQALPAIITLLVLLIQVAR